MNGDLRCGIQDNIRNWKMLDQYLNKIIQGDCLEVMKDIDDKSVDTLTKYFTAFVVSTSYRVNKVCTLWV